MAGRVGVNKGAAERSVWQAHHILAI